MPPDRTIPSNEEPGSANKFLEKLDANSRKSVLTKIGILKTCLETQNVYPPEELDIKKLKGELKGDRRNLYL
ncbi:MULTISPECIES: hypothetical protein [unclassified Microcystis]|uniref:hypothetical protein n=1 Tax=unclassified Microcystis TaxID=2643300 RepID=UPI00257F6130|nr:MULTISPECIES: hypothetical protein [unclassified Microcystis]